MATKIDAYSAAASSGPASTVRPANVAANGSSSASSPNVQKVDSVKLTPDAVQLQQLEKAVSSIPVTNKDKVAQVRQALADGTYKIDPGAIAGKLARMELDLAKAS